MRQKIDFVTPDEGVIATAFLDDGRVTVHSWKDSGKVLCERIAQEKIGPMNGPAYTIRDGKPFFDELPHRYRNYSLYATKPRDEV